MLPGTVRSDNRHMPSVDKIISYWREADPDWLYSYYIGWTEPFCFACNWLPPVPYGRRDSWRRAARWMQRAHLQDHVVVGDDSPANVVMLCHLCHDVMPEFDQREQAIAWIRAMPDAEAGPHIWLYNWQWWTDATLRRVYQPSPNTLFRARAQFLEALQKARHPNNPALE